MRGMVCVWDQGSPRAVLCLHRCSSHSQTGRGAHVLVPRRPVLLHHASCAVPPLQLCCVLHPCPREAHSGGGGEAVVTGRV